MNWAIWGRKALVGTLVAAGLGAVAAVTTLVNDLGQDPHLPYYIAFIVPLALHWLGMAQNYLKHSGESGG